MPRVIEISIGSAQADTLIARLLKDPGVLSVTRHRDAAVDPPGDVVTFLVTTDSAGTVVAHARDVGFAANGPISSIVSNEPRSLVTGNQGARLDEESAESTLEDMVSFVRRVTNIGTNFLTVMGLAGVIAAIGLWTDPLHLVIGAMIIAPGFEPLLRAPFGAIAKLDAFAKKGVLSTTAGYAVMLASALLATLALRIIDPGASLDLETRQWVSYWSTPTAPSVLVSIAAAAAGGFIIATTRSVLTAGVMIALALVPSMAIAGMAIATWDMPLLLKGLVRWSIDALAVIFIGGGVLLFKLRVRHKRNPLA